MSSNIDNLLDLVGLGESSVPSSRIISTSNAPFNAEAYAECYEYALLDGHNITIDSLRLRDELISMRARGEGLDDIKSKIKEGVDKVKKVLLELYDKAIRFFTETVAYFFSNEKKIGTVLPKLKAAVKKVNYDSSKTGDIAVKDYKTLLSAIAKQNIEMDAIS